LVNNVIGFVSKVRYLVVLGCIAKPNKSVKGTRRPLAVLKISFLSRFGGFVSLSLAARPLP